MNNPFETIDNRLSNIECLLLDIRKENAKPIEVEIDKIFDIQQAADFLHLKTPTLYGLTSKRILPCFKRGKRVYFKRSELTKWLEAGKRKTVSDLETEANNYTKSKSTIK